MLAATRSQNDHVLARLCYPLNYDAVSNHEPPWVLTRMVRSGDSAVLIVSNVCSQRPGRRSRLGYLEGHPNELLVHVILSRALVGYPRASRRPVTGIRPRIVSRAPMSHAYSPGRDRRVRYWTLVRVPVKRGGHSPGPPVNLVSERTVPECFSRTHS